jgi:hypothetical protein
VQELSQACAGGATKEKSITNVISNNNHLGRVRFKVRDTKSQKKIDGFLFGTVSGEYMTALIGSL